MATRPLSLSTMVSPSQPPFTKEISLTHLGDFDAAGTTFMVDDWIAHTPRDILAKNFGVDVSVFDEIPDKDPYIFNATTTTSPNSGPNSGLTGASAYIFHNSQTAASVPIPGGGGSISIVDSKNFPIATTIAAAIVTLKPGALRELHWHPNVSLTFQPPQPPSHMQSPKQPKANTNHPLLLRFN